MYMFTLIINFNPESLRLEELFSVQNMVVKLSVSENWEPGLSQQHLSNRG